MNPDIKQRWTTALRSGQYIQGQGALSKIAPAVRNPGYSPLTDLNDNGMGFSEIADLIEDSL